MDGWLSKKEVGEYLGGKSPRTVDRWIAKRIIPQGKRFPGGLFWRKDIIDQWLAADQYATKCAKALKLREATAKRRQSATHSPPPHHGDGLFLCPSNLLRVHGVRPFLHQNPASV